MTLPIKAMVACISLLSPNVPIGQDAHHKTYICVGERCATLQSLSLEWRKHPQKHAAFIRKVYGAQE